MSTTDNLTSTCFDHPKNEKNASANQKNMSEANKKKNQKKMKEDNYTETTNRNNNNENLNNENKMNGYLLTRKIKHKHLVEVRSFSEAKISCMTMLNQLYEI